MMQVTTKIDPLPKGIKRGGLSDDKVKYLLIMPAVCFLLVTSLGPMIYSLILSFLEWRITKSPSPNGFVGLHNYTRALTEETGFWNASYNTVLYTFLTVIFTVLFSLLLALLLAPGGKLRGAVQTLLILPFAMSPALIGISFKFMLNPEFGILNGLLGYIYAPLGTTPWLANETLSFVAITLADIWGWTPFITMVLIGGLSSIPKETQEASQIDGAGVIRTFFNITLPQLFPVLSIVIILKMIFSIKSFDLIYMLTNGGPGTSTQTLAHYAYFQGFKYFDMGYAAAVIWLITIPLIGLITIYAKKILN